MSSSDLLHLRLVLGFSAALVLFVRSASGRLAPRAALAPLVFLVTRWPVLLAWSLGMLGFATLMVNGAVEHGKDPMANLGLLLGVSLLSGGGIAVMVVGPVFFAMRAFATAPAVPLEAGESLLRELPANHFLRGEARGGKLLITDRRLAFRPHRFNVQLDTWSMPLAELAKADPVGTRLLVLHDRAGAESWLVVWNTDALAQELLAMRAGGALPA
jgi:hypothetical protein